MDFAVPVNGQIGENDEYVTVGYGRYNYNYT